MSACAEYWRQVLGEWEHSGLSQAEFCRRRNVKAVTFAWWKRQRRGATAARPAREGHRARRTGPSGFVELALPARGGLSHEVVLPGGVCFRLPADFDPERVARLVQALAAAC